MKVTREDPVWSSSHDIGQVLQFDPKASDWSKVPPFTPSTWVCTS